MFRNDNNSKMQNRNGQKEKSVSRYLEKGLTEQKAKLSSKNFDKLMKNRGLSKENIAQLKASMQKGTEMQIRHAKAGEKFVTTHGVERSSGVFVSKSSLGETPRNRISKGALPNSNSAEYETKVELAKDQNLVYGKIAPQPKFTENDPNHISRSGGGEQIITNGGYSSDAVINRDPKYPIPIDSIFKNQAKEYKDRNNIKETREKNTVTSNDISKGRSITH